MCNIKIHETQPLLNLKLDRVMQDIVYKLVPGLQESTSSYIRTASLKALSTVMLLKMLVSSSLLSLMFFCVMSPFEQVKTRE